MRFGTPREASVVALLMQGNREVDGAETTNGNRDPLHTRRFAFILHEWLNTG